MINVVELDERIKKCLSILDENPRSRIFAALAEAYRRRGEFGRAFSVCKNGLRLHPDYGAAHAVMAKLYLHQNMIEQARAAVEKAIELDGPSRTNDLLAAEIAIQSGYLSKARAILNRIGAGPGNDEAVKPLLQKLQDAKRQTVAGPLPTTVSHKPTVEAGIPPGPPVSTSETTPEELTLEPLEIINRVMQEPRVNGAALWNIQEGELAQETRPDSISADWEPILRDCWDELHRLLAPSPFGRPKTLRIEDSGGQVGIRQALDFVAAFIGRNIVKYASVAKILDQHLARLSKTQDSETAEAAQTGNGSGQQRGIL